ncbi:MAG: ferredoxin-thioredoxin reductase catalytic domain-containing protein [Calditrichota bacterium]
MNPEVQYTLDYLKQIADRLDLVLNPNEKALARLVEHLNQIQQRYGQYFCPCKRHYPLQESVDPICPCPEFQREIAQNGCCECHLFWEKGAAAAAKLRPGLLATITCPG